jgi:hypothetical protein
MLNMKRRAFVTLLGGAAIECLFAPSVASAHDHRRA